MANNYLQFSEVILHLTPEEATWLEERLAHDKESDEVEQDFEWGIKDDSDQLDELSGRQCVQYLWIYAEENGEPEHLEKPISEFLAKFRPSCAWILTWAVTCSEMQVGEFSGGAMIVTKDGAEYMEIETWADNRRLTLCFQDVNLQGPPTHGRYHEQSP